MSCTGTFLNVEDSEEGLFYRQGHLIFRQIWYMLVNKVVLITDTLLLSSAIKWQIFQFGLGQNITSLWLKTRTYKSLKQALFIPLEKQLSLNKSNIS
jgi:hypothetical protein